MQPLGGGGGVKSVQRGITATPPCTLSSGVYTTTLPIYVSVEDISRCVLSFSVWLAAGANDSIAAIMGVMLEDETGPYIQLSCDGSQRLNVSWEVVEYA